MNCKIIMRYALTHHNWEMGWSAYGLSRAYLEPRSTEILSQCQKIENWWCFDELIAILLDVFFHQQMRMREARNVTRLNSRNYKSVYWHGLLNWIASLNDIGSGFLTSHGRHLGKGCWSKQRSLHTVLLKMPVGHFSCIVFTSTFPKWWTACVETLRHRSEPIVRLY